MFRRGNFFEIVEEYFKDLVDKLSDKKILEYPFRQIPYREAMDKYGSDKPDMRFGLELFDVTDVIKDTGMTVFKDIQIAKGILVPQEFTRKQIDDFTKFVQARGAGGLLWFHLKDSKSVEGSVAKYLDDTHQRSLLKAASATGKVEKGKMIFVVAGEKKVVYDAMGALRTEFGDILGLRDPDKLAFAWIVDFPMYQIGEESGKIEFGHNPFSMPQGGMKALKEKDPLDILAYQYDLIANGYEISSGAIRNHEPETFIKAFEIIGYSRDKVIEEFGHMVKSFQYGAPPHGGLAPGIDRLMMMLFDEPNIREVYAFPLSASGQELMTGAPRPITKEELDELGLKVVAGESDEVYQKIIKKLDDSGVVYQVIEHKPVKTSEEAASVRGTPMNMAPKAMIIKKESGEYVMFALPADEKLDIEAVRKIVKQNVRLATPQEVETDFGIKVGAVPPFGPLLGMEMYLDKEFWDKDEIVFNAGRRDRSIRMKALDLIKAAEPLGDSKNYNFRS